MNIGLNIDPSGYKIIFFFKSFNSLNAVGDPMKTKDGQKLLMDLIVDSAKENNGAIAKNLRKLNNYAEKYED